MQAVLKSRFLLLLAAGAVAVALVGCGGDDNGSSQNTNQARVRTFNAFIPAAGATGNMTVTGANNQNLTGVNGLGFGQSTGSYVGVPNGSFTPSGTGQGLTTPLQIGTATSLTANKPYTLVATGQAGTTGTTAPQFIAIPDFLPGTAVIPQGDVGIRMVNLSANPNNPGGSPFGLSLYVANAATGVPTQQVDPSVSNVTYGFVNNATNGYAFVPASMLTNLALVEAGNTSTPLTVSGNLNTFATNPGFQAGHLYTLYVYGPQTTGQPLQATWVLDGP